VSLQLPPPWLLSWSQVQAFLERVRRVEADATPSSWWRSVSHNAAVGGHPFSQHLLGTAADFVPQRGWTNAELAAAARRAGLIAIDEGDHVHLQLHPAGTLDHIVDHVRRWL
jgi:hypothetical protein